MITSNYYKSLSTKNFPILEVKHLLLIIRKGGCSLTNLTNPFPLPNGS